MDFGFLTRPGFLEAYLSGLGTTLWLLLVSLGISLAIGLLMAFFRQSRLTVLRGLSHVYVEIFRNVPLLIQMYFFYRGLQSIGLPLSPHICGILALSLYTGAYFTEIFRAGLLAIPREQLEGALSLGLSRLQVYRLVLIPQAVKIMLPALGNQVVSLAKNTPLVAFITVPDLFHFIYKGAVDSFLPVEYFLLGAVTYLLLSLLIGQIVRLLEKGAYIPGLPSLGWKETRHA